MLSRKKDSSTLVGNTSYETVFHQSNGLAYRIISLLEHCCNSETVERRKKMPKISIEQLGPMLKERRGGRGIRSIATEIGVSAATLSRIESGKQPDLDTFAKICKWLDIDAGEVLGCSTSEATSNIVTQSGCFAHFRADRTLSPETARHLGELILAVQQAVSNESSSQR
jgi:transcriptional regulator with XRE-family HTH domain